ncbi:hypothetical protein U14_01578 [Candidatus Moduliflexus flocculans]|uniref:DUF3368 domain-containing protein n=1 Tax=Candidatus Moduliflexus flocculans TaxID=1499966 RepID=A0A0S6VZ18_9BACT|nr:hypothetical protein U14_01578 [Candidatus Moduliflexus flocculans]
MQAKPVISNNTPLAALWSIGQVSLLRALYGEILIPQAVYYEFLAVEQPKRQELLLSSPWIIPVALEHPRRALAFNGLDAGEAEVLALAEELDARLLIVDERKARQYAKRLGMPFTGTLGVLLAAKTGGHITAIFPYVHALLRNGLYLAPEIIIKALELAGESKGA